jgi:hypothetical protein
VKILVVAVADVPNCTTPSCASRRGVGGLRLGWRCAPPGRGVARKPLSTHGFWGLQSGHPAALGLLCIISITSDRFPLFCQQCCLSIFLRSYYITHQRLSGGGHASPEQAEGTLRILSPVDFLRGATTAATAAAFAQSRNPTAAIIAFAQPGHDISASPGIAWPLALSGARPGHDRPSKSVKDDLATSGA